jgi:hypothetical protein
VSTAFVNAGVEGTEGLVKFEADSTFIIDFRRQGRRFQPAGVIILTSGQSAIARQAARRF